MKNKKKLTACLLFCFISNALLLAQGVLSPPGAPAPTMKTLTQLEPRTDLATVSGDASYHNL